MPLKRKIVLQPRKKIMGLVLRKMVDKYLSNNNAQTRVGIEGQLAGLWFGPDEYLVKKNGCPDLRLVKKFTRPCFLAKKFTQ